MNIQAGGRAQPPVGHVLRDARVVGAVFLARLNDDEVPVRSLDVVRVPLRLHLDSILEPINLK